MVRVIVLCGRNVYFQDLRSTLIGVQSRGKCNRFVQAEHVFLGLGVQSGGKSSHFVKVKPVFLGFQEYPDRGAIWR